jgi:hypothetical protein
MSFFPNVRFRPQTLDELLATGAVARTDDALIVNKRMDGGYIPAKPLPADYYPRRQRLIEKGIVNPSTVSGTTRAVMVAPTEERTVSRAVAIPREEMAINYFPDEDWKSNSNPVVVESTPVDPLDTKLAFLESYLNRVENPERSLDPELMRQLALKKQGLL